MPKNKFDIIIWGASGFTGKWVAKHMYDTYKDTDLKWAIAGRNEDKLKSVLSFIGSDAEDVPCLIADSKDEDSLRELAAKTSVILTTVGPYAYYGSELVKVCAETGTHYCDLTGEVPWMRRMIDQYQEVAKKSGARIVFSCGFDSIPSDMGVHFLQQHAKAAFGKPVSDITLYVVKMKGGASGGTIHSLLNVIEEAKQDESVAKLLNNPYSLNPNPDFEGPDMPDLTDAQYDDRLKKWTAPFVMAGINTRIVRRTNALLDFSYGEAFRYKETQVMGRGLKAKLGAKSMSAGVKALWVMASKDLSLSFLKKFVLPKQGQGPKVDPEDPGFYVLHLVGTTDDDSTLTAVVKGDSDPGYGSTSKMLSEAAICLSDWEKSLDIGGGCWTPASAMGDILLNRLRENAGLTFDIQ